MKTFTFDQSYVDPRRYAGDAERRTGARSAELAGRPECSRQDRSGIGFSSSGSTSEQLDTMQDDKATHVAAAKVSGGNTLQRPV